MELLVRVYHLGASPIYGMTSVSCMFCEGRLGQVPTFQGSSVFFHSMLGGIQAESEQVDYLICQQAGPFS